MAENSNILITVTTDSEGAVQNIDKLGTSVNKAGESTKNFRQQIKELTNELQTTTLPKTSDEYLALKTRLEQLKDAQKDFNEEIGANAGPAFESAGNNLRNLQSRLGSLDFAGAGDSINGLAKNIKGLNFSGATEGGNAFGKSILNLGKALLTNPIFLIGGVIALIVTNFSKLAEAIPAVGIAFRAIGDAIGFVKDLVVGFTDAIGLTAIAAGNAIDKAIGNKERVNKELDNQRRLAVAKAKETGQDVDAVNAQFQQKRIDDNNALINQINNQEATGVKLTEKQLEQRQKLIDENTEFAISAAEREAGEVEKARNDAAAAEEKRIADEARAAEQAAAAARQRAAQRAAEIKAREKEVTDAITASREEQFQATLSAEEKELRQVALKYQQLQEKAGGNKDLQKQIIEQERVESQAIRDRYFEQELATLAEQDAIKLANEQAAAAKANEERIAREDAQFALEQELRLKNLSANEAARQKAVQDLVADYDAKLLLAKGNAQLTADLEKQRTAELEKINQDYRDAEKASDEKAQKDKLDAFMATSDMISKSTQDGLATLSSLNELFAGKSEASQKKAFQRNKALQIAQAGVATYQSATAAYASQVIPGDPTSVARGFIAAAAAVAAGLANIAKIKATTFSSPAPSGGSSGGGGGLSSTGVASSGAPEFNPLSALNFNQPQQIQPAYVLASDIASSMEARSKVEDLSRL